MSDVPPLPPGYPSGYQAPPGAGVPPGYTAPVGPQRRSRKAVWALVTAILGPVLGIFCFCLPMPIAGIIAVALGRTARSDIRNSGGAQTGEGVANAAEVIGWIEVGLVVLLIPLMIVLLILLGNQTKNVFSNISAGLGTQ